MKANEGGADRVIRVIVGIVLIVVAFTTLGVTSGSIGGIIAAVVGVVALLTGLSGFCPAYKLIGLSTCSLKGGD